MSIPDVNNYIKFKLLEYEYYKLMNDDLQEQYKEDFADFTEATFKACSIIPVHNLRTLFCDQGVQIKKDKRVTIARSLYNTLCEKDPTEWTKEQILDQVQETNKFFASSKLNKITSFVPNILN